LPDYCHPQAYTEAKDDVIEQAYTSGYLLQYFNHDSGRKQAG
jgi:hypothetical protein